MRPSQPPRPRSPRRGRAVETGEAFPTRSRDEALAAAVANQARRGWRVVARSNDQAVVVKDHRPNHRRHLGLTIVTLGVWSIVWIIATVRGGEEYRVIAVDDHGHSTLHPYA